MKVTIHAIMILLGATRLGAQDAKALWVANCAPCHGSMGNADTKMGRILGAMDLTDAKKQNTFSDAQAADTIKNGVKKNGQMAMTAFGSKLNDGEIKALVAYVRTLRK